MPKAVKPYHHGDLKNALVGAGIDLLETQGLPGLSLRAIAAAVGVSHTAPKNHFGSLRGVLTAIGIEGFHRHAAFMRQGVDAASGPKARQLAAMEAYAVLADISVGLDWDKARAPDGQRRTEMMLWSLVHGYAKLRLSGQFSPSTPAGTAFDIADIMPDFGYLGETQTNQSG